MSHQHHNHCKHALEFCEKCDKPYCTKCNREWPSYTRFSQINPWIRKDWEMYLGNASAPTAATLSTTACNHQA